MSDETPAVTPRHLSDADRLRQLRRGLDGVLLRDRPTLEKRLKGLSRRLKEGKPVDRGLAEVERPWRALPAWWRGARRGR